MNIVIDDDLMDRAMAVSGLKSKKDVVHVALVEFVQRHSEKNCLTWPEKSSFRMILITKHCVKGGLNSTGKLD